MGVLNSDLTGQLEQLLDKVVYPIQLVASLDDSSNSDQVRGLVNEVAALSDKVTVVEESNERTPSFAIRRVSGDGAGEAGAERVEVRFAGAPLGHEFTSLVLALLHVGGHPPKISEAQAEAIKAIDTEHNLITYMSLTCTNCPDVVQALNIISVLNPKIKHTAVEGGAFREEVEKAGVMAVPSVYENGEMIHSGRADVDQLIGLLDDAADDRAAEELSKEDPFEVLIVGGGPAASASAIYAARKGIRTGIVTERRGGQVLDTMAIENHVSQLYTEGPKLAEDLKQHVEKYEVPTFAPHVASELIPGENGDLHTIKTASGGEVKAKTVLLETGATWRLMGVPGESEYRNKGVSFCPHCDGPLFKNQRIAVVGGGNSGVEAAIDLAGVAEHVTVLEFMDELKADAVLVDKLKSLPNTDIIINAKTTEVVGDGDKVTGLAYENRESGESHKLDVAGVFVQIGLMPNTDWLKGTVKLSDRGEIDIDSTGATSIPGVFAAGDCTTVPFKQIVVAYGAGAIAALSAFDYLIRHTGSESD